MNWNAIRAQFFLTYAVIGSLLPFLPLWLSERGLTTAESGMVLACSGLAIFVTPVVVSFFADTRFEPRRLLAWVYALTALSLVMLYFASGFWTIFWVFVAHSLAFAPVAPLQDGVCFGAELECKRRIEAGEPGAAPPPKYHRIRVWGTIGFILPSLILFALMFGWIGRAVAWMHTHGWIDHEGNFQPSTSVVLICGTVFAFMGFANTFALPDIRSGSAARTELEKPGVSDDAPEPAAEAEEAAGVGVRGARVPTFEAARAMISPGLLTFCLAMLLVHIAGAFYYNAFPLLLTRVNGMEKAWVGLVANLGVVIEVFFVLALGRMESRLGLRGIVVLGASFVAARMACLAASAWLGGSAPIGEAGDSTRSIALAIAIGSQFCHGMMVVTMHLAAPLLFNRVAEDRYRNSMQGLYSMSIVGVGRIVGSLLAGWVGGIGMPLLFSLGVALSILAAVLFARSLRGVEHHPEPLLDKSQ